MTEAVVLTRAIPSQLAEWMEVLADAHAELEASEEVLNARRVAESGRLAVEAAEGPFRARIAEAEGMIRAAAGILQQSAETPRVKVTYRRASESPFYPAEDLRRVLLMYPDAAHVLQPIQKVRFSPARVDIRIKDELGPGPRDTRVVPEGRSDG